MKKIDKDRYDNVYGDKGICSTTHDVFKFCNALFSGKIIKKETLEMALQPMSKEKKTANYGLGWRMRNFTTANKLVFHNGWWHGYRTAMQRRISDGSTVVILSNRLNSSVYQTWKIFGILDDRNVNDTTGIEQENAEE